MVACILAVFAYGESLGAQSTATILGSILSISVFPAITFLVRVVTVLFFYEINKKKEVQIEQELMARRTT